MIRYSLLLIISLYFIFSCSNEKHIDISQKGLYVIEPTIFYDNKTIDVSLPIITNSNELTISEEMNNRMSRVINDYIETNKPAGMGISLYFGGNKEWKYSYGYADIHKSQFVDDNTLFHSASTGKLIMATIIFTLIQDGLLNLNDNVSQWFNSESLFEGVTIDHLLSHTSGIVTFEILKEFQNKKQVWGEEELIKLVLTNQNEKLFTPGCAFHYSNTGYVMLGMIARMVTGESLDILFHQRVKIPAGLNKIFYLTESNCNDFKTASFDLNNEYIPLPTPTYAVVPRGAGAFAGTPSEFSMFLNALFIGKILNQTNLKLLTEELRLVEESEFANVYYGRGLRLIRITYPGKESDYVGHSGQYTGFGFTSHLYHCINRNVTVSIMTNQELNTDPLLFKLSELFPSQ